MRAGRVDEALVDRAVRRMLELKFRAGLFERPYADAARAERITGNAEGAALALEAARKSIVLLKNDGILPLDARAGRKIAVIGPNAAVARLGGYSNEPRHKVSLADLFCGKNQLIAYHFMFGPGWKAGCAHCSFWCDHYDSVHAHLGQLDTTLAVI